MCLVANWDRGSGFRCLKGKEQTFDELAAIDLARRNLESDNMALRRIRSQQFTPRIAYAFQLVRQKAGCRICTNLRLVQQLDWDADCARHGCSLLSFDYRCICKGGGSEITAVCWLVVVERSR